MIGAAGLTFAIVVNGGCKSDAAGPAGEARGVSLSPWASIAPDGTISVMSAATEMGQGSMTLLPVIFAEELDADWATVRDVPERIYGNPAFGGAMYTAGSTAVTAYFTPLRTFGAQVRWVLLDNAARKWGVPLAELTTEPNQVMHAKSGRRLTYGEIAAFAEIPAEAPETRPGDLKKTSAFRLVGKDVMRVELPNKVNGTATYSIDLQIPGMIYGAMVQSPVEGGTPDKFDEAAVKPSPASLAPPDCPTVSGCWPKPPVMHITAEWQSVPYCLRC